MKAKADRTAKTRYSVPAVDRMLDIIEHMAAQPKPCGITDLSKSLKINTNSVFRILKRLSDRGYAELDPATGKYQLSTSFFTLGMSLYYRFDLRQIARRHLEDLSAETGETTQIHIPSGDRMLVLDVVVPKSDYFLQVVPGSRPFYHCNAFGKAVLAFMDEEEVRSILKPPLPSMTKNTLTDLKSIFAQFANVRRTGIAFDAEEYINGIFCVGAPVFDINGRPIAGVGITGLTSRYHSADNKRRISLVLETAEKISQASGYKGRYFAETMRRG